MSAAVAFDPVAFQELCFKSRATINFVNEDIDGDGYNDKGEFFDFTANDLAKAHEKLFNLYHKGANERREKDNLPPVQMQMNFCHSSGMDADLL